VLNTHRLPPSNPALGRMLSWRLMSMLMLTLILTLLHAACGSPPPAPQLYQLRAAQPGSVAGVTSTQTVQLLAVKLPELLERNELLLPQGRAGVTALSSHRWAEPLSDAVPRLLRSDLSALLGEGRVWVAPLPPGVKPTRQLRLDILSLQANEARSAVMLQVRFTLSDPSGTLPPQVQLLTLESASSGPTPDALVEAHRAVLWQLAQRLAQVLR